MVKSQSESNPFGNVYESYREYKHLTVDFLSLFLYNIILPHQERLI